jgi:hypothetical protein
LDYTTDGRAGHGTNIIPDKHMRDNNEISTTLKILIETYTMISGSVTNPFQDTTDHPYITSPWIDTTRTFLRDTNTSITLPQINTPLLLLTHDKPLMRLAMAKKFSTRQLQLINNCRIWLQVISLAEVSDSSGRTILQDAVAGTTDDDNKPLLWQVSLSILKWPQQTKPNKLGWKYWKILMKSLTQDNSLNLKDSLGQWNDNWNRQRRWLFFTNSNRTAIKRTHLNFQPHNPDPYSTPSSTSPT